MDLNLYYFAGVEQIKMGEAADFPHDFLGQKICVTSSIKTVTEWWASGGIEPPTHRLRVLSSL